MVRGSVVDPKDAEIETLLSVKTGDVVTVKFAALEPAFTATEAGTCATAVLPEDKLMVSPAAGACPRSPSVAAQLVPPTTASGDKVKVESFAGRT